MARPLDSGLDGTELDGGDETCDGLDDDADGTVDEGCPCSIERSCGGLGVCAGTQACVGGLWAICAGGMAATPEVCDQNSLDEDCDGTANEGCVCVDSVPCPGVGECTDGLQRCNAGVLGECIQNGGTTETCDGLDNNCDGTVDEGLLVPSWVDEDGDGEGAGEMFSRCPGTDGWSPNDIDCNDDDININTMADEQCNELDDDCDLNIDEGLDDVTYFQDNDGDGYGSDNTLSDCSPPAGYVAVGGDCDDSDNARHPETAEACNALDDDCDEQVDENSTCGGCPAGFTRGTEGAQTYQFCNSALPWMDANAACEAIGYQLVRVDDADEQTSIWRSVPVDNVSWWIGATGNADNMTVTWVSGTSSFLFFPEGGHPAVDKCVAMTRNGGKWANLDCSIPRRYVCETGPS